MTGYSAVAKVPTYLWAVRVPLYSSNLTLGFLADQLCPVVTNSSHQAYHLNPVAFVFLATWRPRFLFPFPLTNINTKAQHSQLLGIDQQHPCTRYLPYLTAAHFLVVNPVSGPYFLLFPASARYTYSTVTLGGELDLLVVVGQHV